MRTLARPLRPFRHRDHRLLAASMAFSLFASGIWLLAIGGGRRLRAHSAPAAGDADPSRPGRRGVVARAGARRPRDRRLGSIAVAAWRLPRRYLTWMLLLRGAGSAPLPAIGFTDRLWVDAPAEPVPAAAPAR